MAPAVALPDLSFLVTLDADRARLRVRLDYDQPQLVAALRALPQCTPVPGTHDWLAPASLSCVGLLTKLFPCAAKSDAFVEAMARLAGVVGAQERPSRTAEAVVVALAPASARGAYQRAQTALVQWLARDAAYNPHPWARRAPLHLRYWHALRELSTLGKVSWLTGRLHRHQQEQGKAVVFSCSLEPLGQLAQRFPGQSVLLTTAVSTAGKHLGAQRFCDDPACLFALCSSRALGGITLDGAGECYFLDLPWTPAEKLQLEDRCQHPLTRSPLHITYILGKDTLDGDLLRVLQSTAPDDTSSAVDLLPALEALVGDLLTDKQKRRGKS